MTLILAATYDRGVAFAYDKLAFTYNICDENDRTANVREKVEIIPGMAIGISGRIAHYEKIIPTFMRSHSLFSDDKLLIASLALNERTAFRTRELGSLFSVLRETYVIGFMEGDKPQLYFYDDSLPSSDGRPIIWQKDWAGIGGGCIQKYRNIWKQIMTLY